MSFSNNLVKQQYFYAAVVCIPIGLMQLIYLIFHFKMFILNLNLKGVILNTLQVVIFSTSSFRKTAFGFLSCLLAISDTCIGFRYLTYSTSNNMTKVSGCNPSNTMAIVANFSTSLLRSIISFTILITLNTLIIRVCMHQK